MAEVAAGEDGGREKRHWLEENRDGM